MHNRFEKILSLLSPPRTFLFFLLLFLSGVLFLSLFRLGFLLRYHHIASGIPSSILFQSFIIGARFDMVVLSYLLIPYFILSSFPFINTFRLKLTRNLTLFLIFLGFSFLFLLSLVDLEYFSEFGTRLNNWALEYLDRPDFVFYSIWSSYPVIPYLILWAFICFVFIFFILKLNRSFFKKSSNRFFLNEIFYFIFALFLLFFSARGRLKLAPIDWGLAYFSKYDFANQLALNGIHTLGKTMLDEHKESSPDYLADFHFSADREALSNVQGLLLQKNERLEDSLNSIRRFISIDPAKNEYKHPNVVIVFLESWLAEYVGSLGGKLDLTPHFDSLAQNGILFENFFATGTRTNRGLVSVLCSFPSQPGSTLMKKFNHNQPFVSLSRILKEREYNTVFIYGGDLQFDNMKGFFRQQGFDLFVGQEDFPKKEFTNKWGVPDDIVFSRAVEEFSRIGDHPFLGVIVTLSNHEPFTLPGNVTKLYPPDYPNSEYLNAFHYSDWALGRFFHQAEKEAFFKNTIFVLVADHGRLLPSQSDLPLERFHIACLIYSPEILGKEPKRIKKVASQTDLLPTILGLLNKPALHESWGRDLLSLSSEDKGFAMMVDGKRIGWVDPLYFLVDRIGATTSLYNYINDPEQKKDISSEYPEITRELEKKERSFLQLSIQQSAKKGIKIKVK